VLLLSEKTDSLLKRFIPTALLLKFLLIFKQYRNDLQRFTVNANNFRKKYVAIFLHISKNGYLCNRFASEAHSPKNIQRLVR